jgi:hypothetical protein
MIGYCIGHNHGSHGKLCRAIGATLQNEFSGTLLIIESLSSSYHQLGYSRLSLVKTNQMKRRDEEIRLETTRTAWKGTQHCYSYAPSSTRFQEFKSRAGRALPLDNDTTWNSWYLLPSVAILPE